MVDFQGVSVDDGFSSSLFARGMGFSSTSISTSFFFFTFVFRCYCLVFSFLYFRLGRQGFDKGYRYAIFLWENARKRAGDQSRCASFPKLMRNTQIKTVIFPDVDLQIRAF